MAALAGAAALAACAAPGARPVPPPPPPADGTEAAPVRPLAALIADDPALSRFRALAAAGGLDRLVAGHGPVTVVAPSDAAFARLPPGTVEALLQPGNRPSLLHLLRFWIVPGAWSGRANGAARLPTLEGEPLLLVGAPPAVTDAAGRRGALDLRAAADGTLAVLDGVVAPRSIEPGGTAGR